MTSMRPVPATFRISQRFADTFSAQFSGSSVHGAVDWATKTGTPVVAPDDGVIVFADWAWNLPGGPNDFVSRWYQIKPAVGNTRGGGGIITVLRNDSGSHWMFAHLSSNNEAPRGKRVRRGDVIAKTGNTGTSTGEHVHVPLIPPNPVYTSYAWGGIDPLPWLTIPYQANVGTAQPTTGGAKPSVPTPAYRLDHRTSPLYTPQASVPRVYGQARKVTGICVHWWNTPDKAGSHDGTASYLARAGGNTSAHYVVSPGRVTQLVAPQHAAWHSGSAQGNATTIGIECDPRDIPGTLPTVAALIRDLEKTYGSLRIYKHSDWTSTSCPGDYAARIPELINLINNPATVSTQAAPQQTKDWFDMATREELREEIQGSINHMFHRGTKEGAPVMERLSAEMRGSTLHVLPQIVKGILAALVPGRGKAKGDMAVSETLGWDRHSRAHTEAQLSGISRDLDLVLIALAAQQKAETTVTVEEN